LFLKEVRHDLNIFHKFRTTMLFSLRRLLHWKSFSLLFFTIKISNLISTGWSINLIQTLSRISEDKNCFRLFFLTHGFCFLVVRLQKLTQVKKFQWLVIFKPFSQGEHCIICLGLVSVPKLVRTHSTLRSLQLPRCVVRISSSGAAYAVTSFVSWSCMNLSTVTC
jgi:hypothetical protein